MSVCKCIINFFEDIFYNVLFLFIIVAITIYEGFYRQLD
jgi:hypothetical protein